ncbi:MAG TPA: nucleotidyltransferase family protein [Candidatus Wallbacteria bacterium]|nr:nucleotidyltransferase family protein [Candidatus Wallbacteria bacterium]
MSAKLSAAMILCAGFGTRMHDFTKDLPKPMLQIGPKPLLEYTITHLAKSGITNIVINLHYLPEKITAHFGDGRRFGVNISYSPEEKPLGTAGAVKKAEAFLNKYDDFLVLYGDIVCTQDYAALHAFHKSRPDAAASIILHERAKSNSVVEIDDKNKIVRFIERPEKEVADKKQNWVNSGLYCFNKKILDYIPPEEFCDFPKNIFSRLVSEGSLYGFPLNGYRCAIDSPDRYEKACGDLANELFG